jgi:hypothetical protein
MKFVTAFLLIVLAVGIILALLGQRLGVLLNVALFGH